MRLPLYNMDVKSFYIRWHAVCLSAEGDILASIFFPQERPVWKSINYRFKKSKQDLISALLGISFYDWTGKRHSSSSMSLYYSEEMVGL